MREIFNLLNQKEKRILEVFSILLLAAIFFFFFVSLRERNIYFRSVDSLLSMQKDYQKLDNDKMEKENEWLKWKKAREDVKELRKEYFYREDEEYNQLRIALQKIFDESQVYVSDIRYVYTLFEKEKTRKVTISFNLLGSYFSLKKFIYSVEKLQRFLVLEKVDFLETPPEGGSLKLKITLAGYYAS